MIDNNMMIAGASAAGSAFSSLAGGLISRDNARKSQNELANWNRLVDKWYSHFYPENQGEAAPIQWGLTKSRDTAKKYFQSALGTNEVVGGTGEGVAKAAETGVQGVNNYLGQSTADWVARRDAINSDYLKLKGDISGEYRKIYDTRSQNAATQASQAAQGFTNLTASEIGSYLNTGKGLFGDQFKASASNNTFSSLNNNGAQFSPIFNSLNGLRIVR